MNSTTGTLYKDKTAALLAGVSLLDIVELMGTEKAIKRIGKAVRTMYNFEKARARRKMQKKSRKDNRRKK